MSATISADGRCGPGRGGEVFGPCRIHLPPNTFETRFWPVLVPGRSPASRSSNLSWKMHGHSPAIVRHPGGNGFRMCCDSEEPLPDMTGACCATAANIRVETRLFSAAIAMCRKQPFAATAQTAAQVKVFRCGPRRASWSGRDHGPRWKTSQGGSRGGQAQSYGESVRALSAPVSVRARGRGCGCADRMAIHGAAIGSRGDRECDPGRRADGAVRRHSLTGFRTARPIRSVLCEGDGPVIMRRPFSAERGRSGARRA